MSDWAVGDLALYVANSHRDDRHAVKANWRPAKGRIYTVQHVAFVHCPRLPGVGLFLIEDTDPRQDCAWDARDFIKVTPLEADEFDTEVINLLTKLPSDLDTVGQRAAALDGFC